MLIIKIKSILENIVNEFGLSTKRVHKQNINWLIGMIWQKQRGGGWGRSAIVNNNKFYNKKKKKKERK